MRNTISPQFSRFGRSDFRKLKTLITFGLLASSLPFSIASGDSNNGSNNDLSMMLENSISNHSNGEGLQAFILPDNNDFANIPQDPSNPITREKVLLGKMLYHDTATGINGTDPERTQTWSCASCHHVAAGFKAGIPQGIADGGVGFGISGEARRLRQGLDATAPAGDPLLPDVQPIASPTILNSAFQDLMLWNGSFGNVAGSNNANVVGVEGAGPPPVKANTFGLSGLETQVLAGTNVHRLGFDKDSVLQTNSEYRYLFARAFPDGDTGYIPDNGTVVTKSALGAAKAIAAYERTIVSDLAPFQKWLKGERNAMNQQQLRGALVFFGKANCASCHTGPALSSQVGATADEMFFALGFNDLDPSDPLVHGVVDDATKMGRGGFTGDAVDNFKFKIPPLYNLVDTNVFGHGASFNSVREVVEYKNAAIAQNPAAVNNLSERFVPLGLSNNEVTDLVAFVEEGLYDQWLHRYVPSSAPTDSCFPVSDIQSVIDLGCISDQMPTQPSHPVCMYTTSDPDGSGYGWENNASCLLTSMPSTSSPTNNAGIDANGHPLCLSASSDPDGDGWGWEKQRSCRVAQ